MNPRPALVLTKQEYLEYKAGLRPHPPIVRGEVILELIDSLDTLDMRVARLEEALLSFLERSPR